MNKLKRYFCYCYPNAKALSFQLDSAIQRDESIEIVKQWLRRVKNINAALPESKTTPLHLAIRKRNRSVAKLLLDNGADTEQRNSGNSTPLILTCSTGYLDGTKLLVEYGADLNVCTVQGLTCLHLAAKNRHLSVVSYLLEKVSSPVNKPVEDACTLLHYVVLLNDERTTANLISKGADINAKNHKGETPVILATEHNCIESLIALLEAGADPNIKTNIGEFPLNKAVNEGQVEAVMALLSHGADRTITAKLGRSPIDFALSVAIYKRVDVVFQSLVNKKTTALELAIKNQSRSIVKLLLNEGVDVECKTSSNLTPLQLACASGFLEGVKLLIEHNADIGGVCSSDGYTCLILAAKKKHLSVVFYLLDQESCPVNAADGHGFTALHYVVFLNNAFLTSKLICRGADINAQSIAGEVPVFLAAKKSRWSSLRVLLEAGADPNYRSCAFWTAIDRYDNDVVRMLLRHGANSMKLRQNGTTALNVAIDREDFDLMKLLLDQGFNVEYKMDQGWTPLLTACRRGFLKGVRLLIERGADITARSSDGMTCLLVAAKWRYHRVVSYLLEQDSCPVTDAAVDGYTALHFKVVLNDPVITLCLIHQGANINAQNQRGETPLFLATKYNHTRCLRMLLEAGADPNISTEEGAFALTEAVNQGNLDTVQMLLRHGADRTKIGRDFLRSVKSSLSHKRSWPDIVHGLLNEHQSSQPDYGSLMESKHDDDEEQIEVVSGSRDCIYCPITFDVMRDPVIATDGHTYERKAIERWLRQKKESPITRQPISSSVLIPNLAIKNLVDQNASIFDKV
eukprot:g6625.t1